MISGAKKLFRMLRERLRNRSLGARLLALLLFTQILPLVIYLLQFNRVASENSRDRDLATAQASYRQVYDLLDNRFDVIRKNMQLLLLDTNIRELIQNPAKTEDLPEVADRKALALMTVDYLENRTLWDMQVDIYLPESKAVLIDNRRMFSEGPIRSESWYWQLVREPYKKQWFWDAEKPGSPGTFCYAARVCNPKSILNTVAVIRFRFSEEALRSTLGHALSFDNGYIAVADDDGQILLRSGADLNPTDYGTMQELAKARSEGAGGEDGPAADWQRIRFDGAGWNLHTERLQSVPFYLVYAYQENDSWSDLYSRRQWQNLLLVVAATGAVMGIILTVNLKQLLNRIRAVSMRMSQVRNGQLQPLPQTRIHDEIGILTESYNYMAEELNLLRTENQRAEQNRQRAEIAALQAQINPHFLYNTLEMINYFSMIGDTAQVEHIVILLSRFYRQCLSRKSERTTLRHETELIRTYCEIQKIRFGEKIRFEIDIPEALQDAVTPHIFLQPLVENAIYHGINQKENPEGWIRVTAEELRGELRIHVSDNGAGMTEERMRQLTEGMDSGADSFGQGNHIGLRNISARIIGIYGEGYGLRYSGAPGQGTTVTVVLPYRTGQAPEQE